MNSLRLCLELTFSTANARYGQTAVSPFTKTYTTSPAMHPDRGFESLGKRMNTGSGPWRA